MERKKELKFVIVILAICVVVFTALIITMGFVALKHTDDTIERIDRKINYELAH